MHAKSHEASALGVLVALLLAGCAEPPAAPVPAPPLAVPAGTQFTYETSYGDRVTFTARGVETHWGQDWHSFDVDGFVPAPIDVFNYLRVSDGGTPIQNTTHIGPWHTKDALRFLLWDLPEGPYYSSKTGETFFEAQIEQTDTTRMIEFTLGFRDPYKPTEAYEIEYQIGEVMPRRVTAHAMMRDGEWTRSATMTLDDAP